MAREEEVVAAVKLEQALAHLPRSALKAELAKAEAEHQHEGSVTCDRACCKPALRDEPRFPWILA
jgi:hypothetical protein